MGTVVSKSSDLSENDYIKRFVAKEHITPNDPFWNRFLSVNIKVPKDLQEQLALDTQLEPFCQQMLSHNLSSDNFGSLIQVFLARAYELQESNNYENAIFTWQIYNSLFIIRCYVKYLIETTAEEQLILHLDAGVFDKGKSLPNGRLNSFLDALIELIVDVPLNDLTYCIHLEAVNCLLILLSVHLYSQCRADHSTIYRLVLQGKYVIHAPLLLKTLLQNFIECKPMPNSPFENQGGNSIVLGIAAEIWSYLSFSKVSEPTDKLPSGTISSPLANQSLLLILVLTNHCTSHVNPYRQSVFSCWNSEDNTPIPPTKETTMFKINYSDLYEAVCKSIHSDPTTLLLYLLLHRNQSFRMYVMTRMDLELLIMPILQTLYNAPNTNSHHIYMSLIILLILSEEEAFNKSIHETKLRPVTWYTERSVNDITLGGLLILVVIRTIQYNMLKMRDKYLHTNCLAALANMSCQFRQLHPYVSQRLVSLFETLARKYVKLDVEIRKVEAEEAEMNEGRVANVDNLMHDLSVLEEVLRMVLEIFNSCLCSQLSNNPNLVYTLLYKKSIFEPFINNSAFQDVMQNIDMVVQFFSKRLENASQSHDLDVREVLSTIESGTKEWSNTRMKKFPDLKFKYVEEEQPEEFFIPYVWSLIFQGSVVHFNSENIKLFNMNDASEVIC